MAAWSWEEGTKEAPWPEIEREERARDIVQDVADSEEAGNGNQNDVV